MIVAYLETRGASKGGSVRKHQAALAHVSGSHSRARRAAGLAHELSQRLTAIATYARGCPRPHCCAKVCQRSSSRPTARDVPHRLREFLRGGEFRRVLTEVRLLVHDTAAERWMRWKGRTPSGDRLRSNPATKATMLSRSP